MCAQGSSERVSCRRVRTFPRRVRPLRGICIQLAEGAAQLPAAALEALRTRGEKGRRVVRAHQPGYAGGWESDLPSFAGAFLQAACSKAVHCTGVRAEEIARRLLLPRCLLSRAQ